MDTRIVYEAIAPNGRHSRRFLRVSLLVFQLVNLTQLYILNHVLFMHGVIHGVMHRVMHRVMHGVIRGFMHGAMRGVIHGVRSTIGLSWISSPRTVNRAAG